MSRAKQPRWALVLTIMLAAVLVLTACGGESDDKKEEKTYKIGIMNPFEATVDAVTGFQAGLAERGYEEGDRVTYVMAADPMTSVDDLLDADVDLIYCVSTTSCQIAQASTSDVPIVFVAVTDPVDAGLVASWASPGANITGIASFSAEAPTEGKRLEYFQQTVPGLERVFVAYNPDDPNTLIKLASVQEAADALGIELVLHEIRTEEDAMAVFDNMPDDVDGFLHFSEHIVSVQVTFAWAAAAKERQLPYTGPSADFGALMSFSPELDKIGYQASALAEQILKGSKAGDLPVDVAENQLVINVATAEAIGLEVPQTMLNQADRLVRE